MADASSRRLSLQRERGRAKPFADVYDADAGAGSFYAKCGFREVGRAKYRNTRLIYFELLL